MDPQLEHLPELTRLCIVGRACPGKLDTFYITLELTFGTL